MGIGEPRLELFLGGESTESPRSIKTQSKIVKLAPWMGQIFPGSIGLGRGGLTLEGVRCPAEDPDRAKTIRQSKITPGTELANSIPRSTRCRLQLLRLSPCP